MQISAVCATCGLSEIFGLRRFEHAALQCREMPEQRVDFRPQGCGAGVVDVGKALK